MKHDFYIKDADITGTTEAYTFLREFYVRYPSGKEVAEALHQVRQDLNLIPEIKPKTRSKLKQVPENET